MKKPTLLTIPQAAQTLGCSVETIRRLVRRGSLKAHVIGPRLSLLNADTVAHFGLTYQPRKGRPAADTPALTPGGPGETREAAEAALTPPRRGRPRKDSKTTTEEPTHE